MLDPVQREDLPIHLSADGRVATWNPAVTRSRRVVVRVVRGDAVEMRPSANSGRAKVREGERIEGIAPEARD